MTTLKQRTKFVYIDGVCGHIESMVSLPQCNCIPYTMIICHPHPLHQGTMHNKVVTTLAKSGDALNMQTIRFNFRGVGNSAGTFADGIGEADDVRSVLNGHKHITPSTTLFLLVFPLVVMLHVAWQEILTLLRSLPLHLL